MKSRNFIFSALAASLLFNTAYSSRAIAQSSSEWLEEALGVYQSKIWNAGVLMPGMTELSQMKDGSFGGTYTMNEPKELVQGTLSECQAMQVRVMRCIWNDRYGTGDIEVTFSEDFSSFVGYWGEENSEPSYRWSGER